MTDKQIQKIRDAQRINPYKLFPDNPAPYSHIWELTNMLGEKYVINWDTQTLEHTYSSDSCVKGLKECFKITWAKMNTFALSPGILLKVNHEVGQFELLDQCKELKIDGKSYIPFWKIEPTPGRELPPTDQPDAKWTGFVEDCPIGLDWTDAEKEVFAINLSEKWKAENFAKRWRLLHGGEAYSHEQVRCVIEQKEGHEMLLQIYGDYVDHLLTQEEFEQLVKMFDDYEKGRIEELDLSFLGDRAYRYEEFDCDALLKEYEEEHKNDTDDQESDIDDQENDIDDQGLEP